MGQTELRRTPFRRSSQIAGKANFRLCEVALLGHYPRSARHGSTGREFFHFGVHVSLLAQLGITEQPGLILPPEGY
jgi:hypothetical protein